MPDFYLHCKYSVFDKSKEDNQTLSFLVIILREETIDYHE